MTVGLDPFSPSAYGLASVDPTAGRGPVVNTRPEPGIARAAVTGHPSILSPSNPLVIFGVVLGITVGAIGIASSARVGPVRVAASAGKS